MDSLGKTSLIQILPHVFCSIEGVSVASLNLLYGKQECQVFMYKSCQTTYG